MCVTKLHNVRMVVMKGSSVVLGIYVRPRSVPTSALIRKMALCVIVSLVINLDLIIAVV